MVGTLKGYDQLLNLVLDDVEEMMRGSSRPLLFSTPSSPSSTKTPQFFPRARHGPFPFPDSSSSPTTRPALRLTEAGRPRAARGCVNRRRRHDDIDAPAGPARRSWYAADDAGAAGRQRGDCQSVCGRRR